MSRVLVLDDDPQVNGLMAETLQKAGFKVSRAANAQQAFNCLPDDCELILLNVHMPGMDGPTFLAEAIEQGYCGKVIVVSGDEKSRDLAAAMGADDFLLKPFKPKELLEVVATQVSPDN